jgi:polysaccharide biosynthesis protein VpsQ
LKRWLPFSVWFLSLGVFIACADEGKMRAFLAWVNSIPLGDKCGHVFLIGTLAFLLNRALAGRTVGIARRCVPLAPLLVAAVMTCEETSQIWIPSRTFDLLDLAANYTGCIAAGLLAHWLVRTPAHESLVCETADFENSACSAADSEIHD